LGHGLKARLTAFSKPGLTRAVPGFFMDGLRKHKAPCAGPVYAGGVLTSLPHTMHTLIWSEALSLSMPVMDQTHREFVDLLACVAQSDNASLCQHWARLIEHTQSHFDQEDAWMMATGFAPKNCHSTQHEVVLRVLREGLDAGRAGQLDVVRQMASELALWFPQHAQAMDASLALHLKSMGYDPACGGFQAPATPPERAISGCGGACNPAEAPATHGA